MRTGIRGIVAGTALLCIALSCSSPATASGEMAEQPSISLPPELARVLADYDPPP